MDDEQDQHKLQKAARKMFGAALTLAQLDLKEGDIEALKAMGYPVSVLEEGKFSIPSETAGAYYQIGRESDVRADYKYLELSDLHVGSLGFDEKALRYVLRIAHEEGVVEVHLSGDLVEGCNVYRGQSNYVMYHDPIDQVNYLADLLRAYGFHYLSIKGNHELSVEMAGLPNPLILLSRILPNFIFLNSRCANVLIGGILKQIIHLSGQKPGRYLNQLNATCGLMIKVGSRLYRLQALQAGHHHAPASFRKNGVYISRPGCFKASARHSIFKGGRITHIIVRDGQLLEFYSKFVGPAIAKKQRRRKARYELQMLEQLD